MSQTSASYALLCLCEFEVSSFLPYSLSRLLAKSCFLPLQLGGVGLSHWIPAVLKLMLIYCMATHVEASNIENPKHPASQHDHL